ncbi:hypothetical protein ABZS66_15385 [Dactylosporangium sp. NPDC005572]|uniref:hypothetical protein n=1 Tax=Dactylosporangium sp. NPDC005572 TaxID=3156889 RepID=UPI0033AFE075
MTVPSQPPAEVVTPPSKVAELATNLRLGPLAAGRKGGGAIATLATGAILAGGLFGVAALINALPESFHVKALALVAVLAVLAAIGVTVLTFYMLFKGSASLYAYAGGIVWAGRGRPSGAGWADIDTLYVTTRGAKESSADVVLFDGRSVTVEGHGKEDPDPLFTELRQRLAAHHRPVRVGAFADQRSRPEKETALDDRPLAVISVVIGVFASLALGFGLWKAGLPGPVAAIIAPTVYALLAIALGLAVDDRLVKVGYAFLVVAGIVVLSVAIKILDEYNWAVVAVAVLAVEGAILAVWQAVYVRLPARRPTAGRKRLAAKAAWQYTSEIAVPVAGPRTAGRLLGVPADAPTTTGADAVHGTANGLPVMVFDRWRRAPRITDPVQTVWVVRLPITLPFLASAYFRQHDKLSATLDAFFGSPAADGPPEQHAADPEIARLVAESPARTAMNDLRLPRTWWVDGDCLYATDAGGAGPDTERTYAENLTALAAAFPWPALQARR